MIKEVFKFFYEVLFELKSAKWPSFYDLLKYGVSVFLIVAFASVIFSAMDYSFGYLINLLIS